MSSQLANGPSWTTLKETVVISVIIPAFNEEKLLSSTLLAVNGARAAFHARGWRSELIVCDNNSTDRTAEIATGAGATVVFEPVNQIGRARNTGAGAATGDWLLFIDADSQPSPELFAEAAEAIASGRIIGCGATLKLDVQRWWFQALTNVWICWSRFAKHMAGSFVCVEAAAFRELGGFSDKLFAAEELEFSARLKKLGRLRGKQVTILHRHPLLTSGRKIHLYSARETLGFFLKSALRPRKTLTDRAKCVLWYDGRR